MRQQDLLTPSSFTKRIGKHLLLLDHVLGSGQYGTVYLAFKILKIDSSLSAKHSTYLSGIKLEMEKPLACKIIEREELSSQARRMVENELDNLSRVKSSKVIKLVK